MSAYKVLRGITYGNSRAEVGAVVSDIPAKSAAWLLEQGIIEPADSPKSKTKPKSEPVSDLEGDK